MHAVQPDRDGYAGESVTLEQAIGITIREARRSRGWSAAELGKRVGINVHTVWEIESRGASHWPTMRDCAQALKMTPAGMLSIAELIAEEHKRHAIAVTGLGSLCGACRVMFCEARPYQNADDPSVHRVFRGREHVHLMGDDERELRLFAQQLGMKAGWLQRDRFGIPHFDCTGKFMNDVLASDKVRKLERPDFVAEYRKLKERAIAAGERTA
jgi:transcriptional regulator with XRE-family HTH domain